MLSSFNIYTSLVVQIQYNNQENIGSLVFGIVMGLMLPVYAFIHYFFKHNFSEYREEFETTEKIGYFTRETSARIRQAYPLILIFEFTVFPTLIAIKAISSYNLYICLVLSLIVSAYTMMATPYMHKLDNLRLLIHRFLAAALIICQAVFKVLAKQGTADGGFIFYIPMVLFIIFFLGLTIDGANIVRISYLWIRKRGVIDHSLKMQQ